MLLFQPESQSIKRRGREARHKDKGLEVPSCLAFACFGLHRLLPHFLPYCFAFANQITWNPEIKSSNWPPMPVSLLPEEVIAFGSSSNAEDLHG